MKRSSSSTKRNSRRSNPKLSGQRDTSKTSVRSLSEDELTAASGAGAGHGAHTDVRKHIDPEFE